jgi:ABC-type phosphate/phosphonate transport system substrate-binding protein
VPPDVDDAQSRLAFADLCAALSRATRMPFIRSACNRRSARGLAAARSGWRVSPTLLLTSAELSGAVPLVSSVRQGMTTFHGAMFVREESPIRSMLDLKGTRVAWVAPTSAAGYIFPRLMLASRGIDPALLFASETFLHSHGNVASAVLNGEADVGSVHAVFEAGDPTRRVLRAPFLDLVVPGTSPRILFTTEAIPSDLIVAAARVSEQTRESLASALALLHESPVARGPVLHIFGAESFARYDEQSLQPLREQVMYGRELGVLK